MSELSSREFYESSYRESTIIHLYDSTKDSTLVYHLIVKNRIQFDAKAGSFSEERFLRQPHTSCWKGKLKSGNESNHFQATFSLECSFRLTAERIEVHSGLPLKKIENWIVEANSNSDWSCWGSIHTMHLGEPWIHLSSLFRY